MIIFIINTIMAKDKDRFTNFNKIKMEKYKYLYFIMKEMVY